jgi:PKHD-type hydroxylase
MIIIPELLSAEQAGTIVAALDDGRFNDGNATTGNAGNALKKNLELAADATRKQLGEMVLAAANAHPVFATTAFPAKYSFPMFSRYDPGMYYDFHTDAAIMNMGGANPVRTDLSCTIFLQDPESYGGGELTVEGPEGRRQVKLPAGHAALYNTADLHRVEEVTEGARLAAVFWVQSHVRDANQRAILIRLNELCRRLTESDQPKVDRDLASRSVHDLLRMWAA